MTSRGALVAMIGAPGAGKTTWLLERFPPAQILSLDALREVAAGDAAVQGATPYAVEAFDALLRGRMRFGLTTAVDATNAEPKVRAGLLRVARRHSMLTVAVVLDVSASECIARQADRDRKVSPEVIRAISAEIGRTVHRPARTGGVAGFDVTRWIRPHTDTVIGQTPVELLDAAPWLR